jgi:hypothetical protein
MNADGFCELRGAPDGVKVYAACVQGTRIRWAICAAAQA